MWFGAWGRATCCWLALATGVQLGGCTIAANAVRSRFANEFDCPEASVGVQDLSNRGYRARGCGQSAVYVASCDGFGCFGVIIVRNGGYEWSGGSGSSSSTARTSVPPRSREDTAGQIRALAEECGPFTEPVTVTVAIAREGGVLRVEAPNMPPAQLSCTQQRIRAATFPPSSDASILRVTLSPATAASPTAEPAPPPGPAPEPTATPDPDAEVRALVDGLHDALLACSDGRALAVIASWTASGEVTLAAAGGFAETDVNGCVRAAGSGAHLASPPGAAGTLRHAVH